MVCIQHDWIGVDEQYYDIVCIEPKSGNLVYIDIRVIHVLYIRYKCHLSNDGHLYSICL